MGEEGKVLVYYGFNSEHHVRVRHSRSLFQVCWFQLDDAVREKLVEKFSTGGFEAIKPSLKKLFLDEKGLPRIDEDKYPVLSIDFRGYDPTTENDALRLLKASQMRPDRRR